MADITTPSTADTATPNESTQQEPEMSTQTTNSTISHPDMVFLHHNEPMASSLVIADGVGMEHHSVLVLLKKHIESLSEFGRVEFEIQPFETNGGRQWRDVYFLNEQQATLLTTFMRNSPVVIRFKVALVRAFFAMRNQLEQAKAIEQASAPAAVAAPRVLVVQPRQWTTDQRYWIRQRARQIGSSAFFLLAMRYVLACMESWIAEREQQGLPITDDWFLDALDNTGFTHMREWYEGRE